MAVTSESERLRGNLGYQVAAPPFSEPRKTNKQQKGVWSKIKSEGEISVLVVVALTG